MDAQVVQVPQALPAKCYYCGVGERDFFLDTGIQIEFYGALYFCNECSNHLANLLGYISPEDAFKLIQENGTLKEAKEELEFKILALEQAINSLKAAGFHDGSGSDVVDTIDIADTGLHPDISGNVEVGQPTAEQLVLGESGSTESSDDEGVAKLSPIRPVKKPRKSQV